MFKDSVEWWRWWRGGEITAIKLSAAPGTPLTQLQPGDEGGDGGVIDFECFNFVFSSMKECHWGLVLKTKMALNCLDYKRSQNQAHILSSSLTIFPYML